MKELLEQEATGVVGPAGSPELDRAPATGRLNHADQRRLRQSDALRVFEALQAADSMADRLAIYRGNARQILAIASALWPELMPTLNGEFEWICISTVDLE